MESSVLSTIERCAAASYAGEIQFGEVVRRLVAAGVESYHADYRDANTRYYLPNGETTRVALHSTDTPIADPFDAEALKAAIRGAQRGEVKYPEFLQRSREAGCVGYTVWLAGRHVAYYGRRGEVHIEPFPK